MRIYWNLIAVAMGAAIVGGCIGENVFNRSNEGSPKGGETADISNGEGATANPGLGTVLIESFQIAKTGHFLDRSPILKWTLAEDTVSDDISFEVALGSEPTLTDVLDWQAIGTDTEVQLTGLSLSYYSQYFPSIRATTNGLVTTLIALETGFEPHPNYLKAEQGDIADTYGNIVAISGDTMVVGVPSEDSDATGVNGEPNNNLSNGSGAVYVYQSTAAGWIQQAYLKASNTNEGDLFGISVAIHGDTIAVGASSEDGGAAGVNGSSVTNRDSSGAVYVFARSNDNWTQQAYIKASNPDDIDAFGGALDIYNDTLIVGATREDSASRFDDDEILQANNDLNDAGAAYIFIRNGTTWSQQAYLKAPNTIRSQNFGNAVAVDGETVVVGAKFDQSSAQGVNGDDSLTGATQSGAAFVYVRDANQWTLESFLKGSNTAAFHQFAFSLDISNNTIVIGAPFESSASTGINGDQTTGAAFAAGAAYVFHRVGNTWSQQAYLKASNTAANDRFGESVAISGDIILIGAPGEDGSSNRFDLLQADNSVSESGAAYLFQRSGTVWTQRNYVKAINTGEGDGFGEAVAIDMSKYVVGALFEDGGSEVINDFEKLSDDSVEDSGAVYQFEIAK